MYEILIDTYYKNSKAHPLIVDSGAAAANNNFPQEQIFSISGGTNQILPHIGALSLIFCRARLNLLPDSVQLAASNPNKQNNYFIRYLFTERQTASKTSNQTILSHPFNFYSRTANAKFCLRLRVFCVSVSVAEAMTRDVRCLNWVTNCANVYMSQP